MSSHWKYYVEGKFFRNGTPIYPCEAIVETNDREENSPFRFKGVGPIAKSDDTGLFKSSFLTYGASVQIKAPPKIVVFIKVGIGKWEPVNANIAEGCATAISDKEMVLSNLIVELPESVEPYKKANKVAKNATVIMHLRHEYS